MSVKHGLLAILDRRSMHGYELRRELEDELGPGWAVNYGQIYSTLERLERDGLVVHSETVSSSEAPDRKLYTVTPAGRAELRFWFLAPTTATESPRDELYARIALALTGGVDVDDVIQAQRKTHLRRIGKLTELKEQYDAEIDLTALLQLDLSIAKTEAVIRWLDAAESKIRKAVASAPSGVTSADRARPKPADSRSAESRSATTGRERA